ncbi:MAG: hypothetical protein Q8P48_05890 [Deltaproteobacteria bacterium]|nr:hypothetical protein [Deltaproteobacteria bacterium]
MSINHLKIGEKQGFFGLEPENPQFANHLILMINNKKIDKISKTCILPTYAKNKREDKKDHNRKEKTTFGKAQGAGRCREKRLCR